MTSTADSSDEAQAPICWLAPHVCAAATSSGVVLLDLKRNRYFGVASADAAAVAPLIQDWPLMNTRRADRETGAATLAALEHAGAVTPLPPVRAIPATPTLPLRTLTSVGEEIEGVAAVRIAHAARFVSACLRTSFLLRARSLLEIATSLSQRQDATAAAAAVDLTQVFRRLRPYAFSAKDQCLFHALALRNFLAAHGVASTWVIGVRTRPWYAHSWVQHDQLVLDSSPERISEYAPILAV